MNIWPKHILFLRSCLPKSNWGDRAVKVHREVPSISLCGIGFIHGRLQGGVIRQDIWGSFYPESTVTTGPAADACCFVLHWYTFYPLKVIGKQIMLFPCPDASLQFGSAGLVVWFTGTTWTEFLKICIVPLNQTYSSSLLCLKKPCQEEGNTLCVHVYRDSNVMPPWNTYPVV